MSINKKHLFTATALCTLLLTATACGDTAPVQEASTQKPTEVAESVAETEEDILAYLPDTDMGGWQMDVITHEDTLSGTWTFTSDSMNGEVLNDAIFARNKRIEERYNVKLNIFAAPGDPWHGVKNALSTTVNAGDDAYDMAIFYDYSLQDSIIGGKFFYNMLAVPNLDFSNPWWHKDVNDTYTMYGYLPCVLSDFSVNSYQYANLLVFNKVLAQNLDIPDMYEMVRNHTWTLDSFYKIVKSVTADTNGDGKMDLNDTWGLATNFSYHALTWGYAVGEKGIYLTENGVELGYQSERFADLAAWLYDLFYGSKLAFEIGWDKPCDISWDENRVLMQAIWLNDLENFRAYQSSYGLLPYPAFDESQEMYYTYDDTRCAAFGIPITSNTEDIAKTGLILEALSADSYYNVIPQYLETVVDSKLSRDEESLEMLDYIMAGRIRDIGYAIPDTKQYSWVIYNSLKKSNGSLASALEKNAKAATKFYNKLLETWQELGDMEW